MFGVWAVPLLTSRFSRGPGVGGGQQQKPFVCFRLLLRAGYLLSF